MSKQTINIGAAPNDGNGDPLRTAFSKTNSNFDEVYVAGPVGSNLRVADNSITSTNTDGNIILDPNGNGLVVVSVDNVVISSSKTPATAVGATGDTTGMVAWDASFIYVCVADYDGSTNIWRRASIASW